MNPRTFLRWALTLLSLCGSAKAETVLLDFTASWCGPCRGMAPLVEQLEREGYSIRKVDVDREPELAKQYGVESIPCFIAVTDGKPGERVVGAKDINTLRGMFEPKLVPRGISAVVRIRNAIQRGDQEAVTLGSGTIVDVGEGRFAVLSCAHLFDEGVGELSVYTSDGTAYPAKLIARHKDQANDLSALSISQPPVTPVKLAEDEVRLGESTRIAGYGGDGRLLFQAGQAISLTSANAVVTAGARQGDSGGPIFNSQGQLTAVLWGSTGGSTYGTCCFRVRQFIGRIRGQCPQVRRPQARPKPQQPKGPIVDTSPADLPLVDVGPVDEPDVSSTPDPRIAEAEARLAALEKEKTDLAARLAAEASAKEAEAKKHTEAMAAAESARQAAEANLATQLAKPPPEPRVIEKPVERIKEVAVTAATSWLDAKVVAVGAAFGVPGIVVSGLLWLSKRAVKKKLAKRPEPHSEPYRPPPQPTAAPPPMVAYQDRTANIFVDRPLPEMEAEAIREAIRRLTPQYGNRPMPFGSTCEIVMKVAKQIHDGAKVQARHQPRSAWRDDDVY